MLALRPEQVEALEDSLVDRFVQNLVAHLKENFPAECQAMGDEALGETIEYGVEVAQSYGLTTAHAFFVYVDLMFLFGADFDQDPAHPWAAEILTDPSITEQELVIEALWEEATFALAEAEEAKGADDGVRGEVA